MPKARNKKVGRHVEKPAQQSQGEGSRIIPGEFFKDDFSAVYGQDGRLYRCVEGRIPFRDVPAFMKEDVQVLINPHGDTIIEDQYWLTRAQMDEVQKEIPRQGGGSSVLEVDVLADGDGRYILHVIGSVSWGSVAS